MSVYFLQVVKSLASDDTVASYGLASFAVREVPFARGVACFLPSSPQDSPRCQSGLSLITSTLPPIFKPSYLLVR